MLSLYNQNFAAAFVGHCHKKMGKRNIINGNESELREREREREKKWDFGNCTHSGEVQCPHADERDLKCTLSLLYVPVTQAVSERNAYIFPKVLLEARLVWIYLAYSISFLCFLRQQKNLIQVRLPCGLIVWCVVCAYTTLAGRGSDGIAWQLRAVWGWRGRGQCWCVFLAIGLKFWPNRRETFQRMSDVEWRKLVHDEKNNRLRFWWWGSSPPIRGPRPFEGLLDIRHSVVRVILSFYVVCWLKCCCWRVCQHDR